MPNLIDIVEVAEALETKAVFLAADRCAAVRNRNSTCHKCTDACPTGAVRAEKNQLTLDAEICSACGACTSACPTEALIPLVPLDEDLASDAVSAVVESGCAAFACARMAAKHMGDPSKYVEVPCLARMEESVLVGLAARGVSDILLIDGVCETCKFRSNVPGIDAVVKSANDLIAMQGVDICIQRASAFPDELLLEDKRTLFAEARRGFFTQARTKAKDAAEKTVEAVAFKNDRTPEPSLRERLRAQDTGTLPQFNPMRRMNLLDALDQLGSPVIDTLETRLFGSVSIDLEVCNSCGMCTVFCPTGALRKANPDHGKDEPLALEFSVADCVHCSLCADSCLKHCLTVESVISPDELFDFEPRFIQLPKPPARPAILSSLNR